jgi:uncharacterized protein YbjT (DUF2867 family)
MPILVIGATGTIGSRLVSELQHRQCEVRSAARRPGPGGVHLDLADPTTITEAAGGCESAFLVTPLGLYETHLGLQALASLRAAGVRKIVYMSIMNLELMDEIPHFKSKQPIKEALLSDGVSVALEPNFFFQNDLLALSAILSGGIYPLPVGTAGVWSVDASDIARAAANALLSPDWNGMAVPVCGPEMLTGPTMAAIWSQALGRTVAYPGDAIEPFLAGLAQAIPNMSEWMRTDFEIMMRVTQRQGCPASSQQQAASRAIIGRAPRGYAAFVAEHAKP